MLKKSLIALLMISPVWANSPQNESPPKILTEADIDTLKEKWQEEWSLQQQEKQRSKEMQRNAFLQLERLLKLTPNQKSFSPEVLRISEKLLALLGDYPLKSDAEALMLNAKLQMHQAGVPEIESFIARYPYSTQQKYFQQRPFELFYAQQQLEALIEYATKIAPVGSTNQCRLFSAEFQLAAEKLKPNPEAEQANGEQPTSLEMNKLLNRFSQFWRENTLSEECNDIEAYWADHGGKSEENVRQQAVKFFAKNNKAGLEILISRVNQNEVLSNWLSAVLTLVNQPETLAQFVENQPLDEINKALILQAFPRMIKKIPEQIHAPDFSLYQQWAEKLQLSENEVNAWKSDFLNRLFDNQDPNFNTWRDQQLERLKNDSLIERRLRMAIWQKTDLTPWLNLLSAEGKAKAEWRYWQAKTDKNKATALLNELIQERGFYPMLAAQLLGKPYRVMSPDIQPLSEAEFTRFALPLARIEELKTLQRNDIARAEWRDWLHSLTKTQQLALSDYALMQDWYDLAVEGSIQAKAWDYLPIRLPNAYPQWFELHLINKNISSSFAMAIARQESAWNSEARSSANALGLMQLLPTTASQTAKNANLPYKNEQDLLKPFYNIMLGTAHLEELNSQYPQNRILIAAAYNAGKSRVEKWLTRANGQLMLDEFVASIPFYETRGYIQNVLAYDYYYQLLNKSPNLTLFYPQEVNWTY